MARVSDAEKEALRQAAETATSVLPKLREEYQRIGQRITNMEAVLLAYEGMQGKREKNGGEFSPDNRDKPKRTRAKKGQVAEQIAAVLAGGHESEPRDIRNAIVRDFKIKYGRNTILGVLTREVARFQKVGDKKYRLNPMLLVTKAS